MHKLWATKGCPGFVVELNTYNISAVESHVAYNILEAIVLVANADCREPSQMLPWVRPGSTRK